jgi:hypothetical protein
MCKKNEPKCELRLQAEKKIFECKSYDEMVAMVAIFDDLKRMVKSLGFTDR